MSLKYPAEAYILAYGTVLDGILASLEGLCPGARQAIVDRAAKLRTEQVEAGASFGKESIFIITDWWDEAAYAEKKEGDA